MTRGKRTCKILKEIRTQIAAKNDIDYITSECSFQGECKGTCPKCEEELRYLENELRTRQQLGKVVALAGISLGVAGTFAACGNDTQESEKTTWQNQLVDTSGTQKVTSANFTDTINVERFIPIPIPPAIVPLMGVITIDLTAPLLGLVDEPMEGKFPIEEDTTSTPILVEELNSDKDAEYFKYKSVDTVRFEITDEK